MRRIRGVTASTAATSSCHGAGSGKSIRLLFTHRQVCTLRSGWNQRVDGPPIGDTSMLKKAPFTNRRIRRRLSLSARWAVRSRLPRLAFLAALGPGLISGFADNDAGGITTYSVVGAQFGYHLL